MEVFNFQHIGQRKDQEDAMYLDPKNKLFIVCDGVGGSKYGDVASRLVVDTIVKHYENTTTSLTEDSLKYFINESMLRISRVAEEDVSFDGMATTLSLLYLEEDKAIVAHVGDSRVYHIKNKDEWTVTKDHSMVRELFDAGVLKSEVEMTTHPYRNRITKAIKATPKKTGIEPEIRTIQNIGSNEIFIICSDGAVENYLNEHLVEHFTNETMTLKSLWSLYKENCKQNSIDNNTCILVHT